MTVHPPMLDPQIVTGTPSGSVARARAAFDSGRTRPLEWRRAQLDAIDQMLVEGETELLDAMATDLGKPAVEAFGADIGMVRTELKRARTRLGRWTKPRMLKLGVLDLPGTARVVPEPLGVVLVIAPWNYPVQLVVSPMISAIAAGNTVVAKPSELTPTVSRTLARLADRHLDREAVQVVEGGVETSTALLAERFDHIFFTGSGRVGRIVMEAAAANLTPVTLELGGKSPVIVDGSADIETAAHRIAWGKGYNAGQTCVAADHVLVHRAVADQLVALIRSKFDDFYGSSPETSPDLARIVDAAHVERIADLVRTSTDGDTSPRVSSDRRMAPLLVVDPPVDSPLLSEEIFGPVLPVLIVDDIDQAIAHVNANDKPLVLYVFAEDDDVIDRVVSATSSGAVCVNHTLLQAASPDIPFGGVGASGMGRYHGRYGFEQLSHMKPVLRKPTWFDLPALFPPYSDKKLKVLRRLVR